MRGIAATAMRNEMYLRHDRKSFNALGGGGVKDYRRYLMRRMDRRRWCFTVTV